MLLALGINPTELLRMKSAAIYWVVGLSLIVIGIIALLASPILGTYFNLSDKAQVADAINGLTAPVIGVVGALLVFISFREQVKANALQWRALNEQRELELLYKFYEELKTDLLGIQSIYGSKYSQPSILDSLMNYIKDDKTADSPYPELTQYLDFLFKQFGFIGRRVIRSRAISNEESVYLIEKVKFLSRLYFDRYFFMVEEMTFVQPLGRTFKGSAAEMISVMKDLEEIYFARKELLRQASRKPKK